MKLGIAVVLALASPLLAEDSSKLELAYLSAWYTLEVEEQPQLARLAFDALLAIDELPAERRAMCTVGLARCAVALENRQDAIDIYRRALRLADGHPKIEQRIEKVLATLGRGGHNGYCHLHYGQGFRFSTGKTDETKEADLKFASCAGGISSIEFVAPGGITNLEKALGRRTNLDPTQIYRAVLAVAPDRIQLNAKAEADSRTPESEVFILRTRDGGWVKFAVQSRDDNEPSWQKRQATIIYTYHPDHPVFSKLRVAAPQGGDAVLFNRELIPTDAELAARARARQALIAAAKAGGGTIPDHAKTQEVLLNRSKFNDYEKATFSFYFEVRDDPSRQIVCNDWELVFSSSGKDRDLFHVRTVVDDVSTITDLGELGWADLAARKLLKNGREEKARAEYGHVYLVHTRDRDANSHSLFRVVGFRPGLACHIEWATMRTNTFRTSPGLQLSDEQKTGLKRLLRDLDARSGRDGAAVDPRR